MSAAIDFRAVDVVYPHASGRGSAASVGAALARLDAGDDVAKVAAECAVTVAVRDANLSVAPGEICVMMGLSGSGKSTLLRTANGLTRTTRGQVLLSGAGGTVDVTRCDAAALSAARRRRISMVFQQAALLPWRTVEENVALGLELRGDPRADRARLVAEKLELVGLASWAKRRVDELSGGMQQRVGLARAFATEPDILLMDEPFSALDPLIRSRLQNELILLQERVRKTILFVSHDLDEALRIGDRIAIMDHGRVVQTGTPEDIVLRPADARVVEFVRHMNPLTALTGAMVMRALDALPSDGGDRLLDADGAYRLTAGASAGDAALRLRGAAVPLFEAPDGVPTAPGSTGCAVAPVSTDLRTLVRLRQASGHPVLLSDAGRVVGVCDGQDILRALGTGAAPT
jgi:glycine betaine/proline transport system ATP-binding protein